MAAPMDVFSCLVIVDFEQGFSQWRTLINRFQPGAIFHVETSHLICRANPMTGFYMKYNTGLNWVNTKVHLRTLFSVLIQPILSKCFISSYNP